jgi:hypothetical protein
MYGTIARITPKPGMEGAIIQARDDWQRERRSVVRGVVGGYVYRLDQGGMMLVAVFESKGTYVPTLRTRPRASGTGSSAPCWRATRVERRRGQRVCVKE